MKSALSTKNVNEELSMQELKTQPKKQRGFTLIELVITLAVLAVIIGVMTSGLFQSQEDAKIQAARTQIMKDFPSGITRITTMANSCTAVTTAKMKARGLPDNTVWGTAWAVAGATSSGVTITYPTGLSDPTILTDVADGIPKYPADKSSNITSITVASTTMTIVYRCN